MTDAYAKNVVTSAEEAARIVPRAEFRVFGQDIVEAVKEKMWSCRAQLYKARTMPSETYILSRFTDQANVKVRDGLLDIKTRTGLTPEGYEIFQPRGKFQFPVKKAELEEILSHLKVPMPLEKESYSFEDFKALAASCPDLALVRVDKKRYGFTVNGVICEFAYVWFNGARVETACCESEDYAAMKGAVEALGLAGRPNTNYLRAAKAVIGM